MGNSQADWFKDADFWGYFAPIMFDSARWAEVPGVANGVEHLCDRAAITLGKRILDQCCGMGRISQELAQRGWEVTGVDITAAYLEAARERASLEDLKIEFVENDIRTFVRPAAFDAVVNLYISFGYFDDPRDDLLTAQNAYASLVPGGTYIIETLGKEVAVRDFIKGERFKRSGYTVRTEYKVTDSWAALNNRWILEKDGKRFERCFNQRLYAATELRALLYEAGFASVELYGDWDESPYNEKARILIAVARK